MMKMTFKITSTKVAPPTAPPTIAPDIASSVCWGRFVDIFCVVSVVAVIYNMCVCTETSVHN